MSLRLRLLLAVGLISIAALVVADFATYSALRNSLYNQVDQQLAQHSHPFLVDATGGPSCSTPAQGGPNGANAVDSGDSGNSGNSGPGPVGVQGRGGPNVFGIYFSAVVNDNGNTVNGWKCPAYVGTHSYSPQLPSPITGFSTQPDGTQVAYFTANSTTSGGPDFRVRAVKFPGGNDVLVQAQPLTDQDSTLHTLFLTELAVTAGAIVLALFGGWWLVRLGLRPLEDVEATADAIAAGNLDQRVPGADEPTEVGRLARALNVMLERIQNAFDARVRSESRLKQNEQHLRQFVADASHELRTPIAAVSAYAELFERGAGTRSEDLPRIAAGIRIETERMDRLVSDLLTLARLDEGVPMEREPVELVALVSEGVRTATAVGPAWPVQFWAPHPVEVTGDKDRLRQVVDNLLANVRAHTPEGTTTTVRVDQIGDEAEIEVRDTGPGMPGDEANRIFERFYRSDPARSRMRGGSGLGLSIVAAIVEAHGGTVTASSAPGQGMTVTVRIPNDADVAGSDAAPAEADGATDGATVQPSA
ncbi:MAG TPA: HAMP domain-containing sensor histidine kinase [Acidimicrobiales bacterium]|nr:HAMP domain-containing sensor histidine kinase [Acidimicrobiales bacterium]